MDRGAWGLRSLVAKSQARASDWAQQHRLGKTPDSSLLPYCVSVFQNKVSLSFKNFLRRKDFCWND